MDLNRGKVTMKLFEWHSEAFQGKVTCRVMSFLPFDRAVLANISFIIITVSLSFGFS